MGRKPWNRKREPSPDEETSSSDEESIGTDDEIEKIIRKRIRDHELEYYVKWKGCSDDDNTWHVHYDLLGHREMIKQFEERDKVIRKQHRSKVLAPMSKILGGRKVKPHSAFEKIDAEQEPFEEKIPTNETMKGNVSKNVDKDGDEVSNAESNTDEEDEEYIIDRILDKKMGDDGTELYLIKWLGYDDDGDNTWEPLDNIKHTWAFSRAKAKMSIKKRNTDKTSSKIHRVSW